MLIERVAHELLESEQFSQLIDELSTGQDSSVSVAQSARPLVLASLWACNPRPCLYVVSGEETADRVGRTLTAWLGMEHVMRYPEREDLPWAEKGPDDASIGARCQAIAHLAEGKPCIVVASARSLLRMVPPVGSGYYASCTFSVGDELSFDEAPSLLVAMGYENNPDVAAPGSFHVHGDSLDVFPAQASSPVRIEFFGDEIDRVRRMLPSTGQTIGELESVEVLPCRELALTAQTIAHAERTLWDQAQEDSQVAADLELIQAGHPFPTLERYLCDLYGSSSLALGHISSQTLVCLAEPRALFDDCLRAYDELTLASAGTHSKLEGLYCSPKDLDFGKQQRLSFASMMQKGVQKTIEIRVQQPSIAGSDSKLLGRVRQLLADNFALLFAVPERSARNQLELNFNDEAIPFIETLMSAPENQSPAQAFTRSQAIGGQTTHRLAPLERAVVSFTDIPIPAGNIFPDAKLAVLSVGDLSLRLARHRRRRRVDITSMTFPFKPGDYVVHETHGIALFADIVRQEIAGRERDYFLLEYASQDKLYVPLEQIDRITRYIGPDGSSPRLTRLNTADWSRATGKARKSAKRLAFDLVDLYTRRSSVLGYAFLPDSAEQLEMEESFSYELTPDQSNALIDIKSDMESPKPMDRLLCGDVGFGKTELALRAAFKCAHEGRQVMVLCPTTILAQQHFETFYERLTPFALKVSVLSRFITPAQQRKTLEAFAAGELDVLIGTHRLLSADVNPKNLGLVIIDEEQRFGVQHKEQLKNLREQIDVLTLSATPIPRTMQMAMSGVRDVSLILTPPAGRLPVSVHVGEYDPDLVSAAIRAELERKGQVYYVSNRVNTIDDALERVREAAPEARVAVAHGQMSAREMENVMMHFQEGELDVLVATTIIESGIDNPRTNTLIIEDSQRLGLAQLYQLKGRVGRGRRQAFAYFMFPGDKPLTAEATERLLAINEYQDLGSGMRIAMRDLEIRGAGSLMGAEQHGNLSGVGFDLFCQMLNDAVSEARGEEGESVTDELNLNLPADFYLAEEYLPEVDKRVLVYRKLAYASELVDVDELEQQCCEQYGELPQAGQNLFDRARIRIRSQRLGLSSISYVSGKITIKDVDVPQSFAEKIRDERGLVYPKSRKLVYPYKGSLDNLLATCLEVLTQIGGDDESEE